MTIDEKLKEEEELGQRVADCILLMREAKRRELGLVHN